MLRSEQGKAVGGLEGPDLSIYPIKLIVLFPWRTGKEYTGFVQGTAFLLCWLGMSEQKDGKNKERWGKMALMHCASLFAE
ncbi:MAG: hypothetical protein D3910_19520 [Candidatus Electrothrix sp. ATG2]|nr:hypothetical protein [Candidatus Electrothrix sp. ATG2]